MPAAIPRAGDAGCRFRAEARHISDLLPTDAGASPDLLLHELIEHGPDAVCVCDAELVIRFASRSCGRVLGRAPARLVNRPFGDLVPAEHHGALEDMRVAALAGADARATHRVQRADGAVAWADTRARGMVGDRALIHLVVRDVTDWRRATEDLGDLLADQEALRRVATAIASTADPDTVFRLVAHEIGATLGADGAWVTRADGDRAVVVGSWASRRPSAVPAGSALPLDGGSAVARCLRARRAVRLGDLSIAVPVRSKGAVWGAVSAHVRAGRRLSRAAEQRLACFSELVALAVLQEEARTTLSRLASDDHLTGLSNRRTFDRRLAEEVERARRYGRDLALVVFDVDHFKRVNDTRGHTAGDEVLVEIARRLRADVRVGDEMARVGGEEFAWLLPDTDAEGAMLAAERARIAVRRDAIPGVGVVTVSAGVAELGPADDGSSLTRAADRALYAAKRCGRDLTVCASDRPAAAVASVLRMHP